jgi:sortase (surface protein transpeptidase)
MTVGASKHKSVRNINNVPCTENGKTMLYMLMLLVLVLSVAAAIPFAVEEFTDMREMSRAERKKIKDEDDDFFTQLVKNQKTWCEDYSPLY